jgi:paraquat-inducible protein B
MKNLEDAVVRALDQIPDLAKELSGVVTRMNVILDDVNRRGLPGKAVATLDDASVALAKMNRVLDRLDANDGLLASLQRTSDSLSDVAGPRLGANLDETGRDLREAAVAVRQFVEALQRDPDMLVKGKTKVRR